MKLLLFLLFALPSFAQVTEPDTTFYQPISLKYTTTEASEDRLFRKVAVNYDDIVYVLANDGLYRVLDDQLICDISYRPLADKIPVDISIQEETGYLYYLYPDQFLTNAYAGKPYAPLPEGNYSKLAVNRDGLVLVAGKKHTALYHDGSWTEFLNPLGELQSIHCYQGLFYALTSRGVFRLANDLWEPIHTAPSVNCLTFRDDEILLGTETGYYGISVADGKVSTPMVVRAPVPQISQLLPTASGLWAATQAGAFLHQADSSFRYYASRRWLDQDEVIDLATDSEGNTFLLAPTGLNQITFKPLTLAKQAQFFEKKIRQRHIRYGFIAELRLAKPGDITSAEMIDTDNDGLWSAFYLGSQAYRYAVTEEVKAKRNAWEAFEAYERLLSVNQLEGFPSRTFERKGYKVSNPDRWRDSSDPAWEWKGHTSRDEFVAYIYVASLMDEFLAENTEEKQRVADFIDTIVSHIIDNDYYFVDIDGKPTTWGRWNPEYINWYPPTIRDRRLGSLTLIAGLQLAYDLTGKERFKTEAYRMMDKYGYLNNIEIDMNTIAPTPGYVHEGHDMGSGSWNHSDDEMAFLTYWVIHHHAFSEELRQKYEQAIRNHWEIERPEKNPVWNLISYATEGSFDREATIWALRDFPLDLVRYDTQNSHRQDLTQLAPNFRKQETGELLPAAERQIMRYNANPFRMDGGYGGRYELTGAEYLLPYWMARYLNVINSPKDL
ncbi:MAG: hypothetical protein ACFB15_12130 [Cyclobacteriaceae bacterium]